VSRRSFNGGAKPPGASRAASEGRPAVLPPPPPMLQKFSGSFLALRNSLVRQFSSAECLTPESSHDSRRVESEPSEGGSEPSLSRQPTPGSRLGSHSHAAEYDPLAASPPAGTADATSGTHTP